MKYFIFRSLIPTGKIIALRWKITHTNRFGQLFHFILDYEKVGFLVSDHLKAATLKTFPDLKKAISRASSLKYRKLMGEKFDVFGPMGHEI